MYLFSGTFFLCWGPYVLLNLWAVNNDSKKVPYAADFLTTFLAFSNSSVNPYIFAFLNRDFKAAWKGMFMKVRRSLVRQRRDRIQQLQSDMRGSRITIMEFSQAGSEIISVASFSCRRTDAGDVPASEVICTVKISSTVEAQVEGDETSGNAKSEKKGEETKSCDVHLPGQVD
jgi:hypothetical protein